MARPVDLTTADLGRHLKNGDLLLHGTPEQSSAVLHRNYFSVVAPNEPFVNHHWLTGVLFYEIWRAISFDGLAIFYYLLIAGVSYLLYFQCSRLTDPVTALALAAAATPILSVRPEPRPEGFTFLFLALFYALLSEWYSGRLNRNWLWSLPVMMVLWVNLHIAFIVGFAILGTFVLKALQDDGWNLRGRLGLVCAVSAACAAATLVNPSGWRGVIYPVEILGRINFRIVEFQSLSVLFTAGGWAWPYLWFFALAAALVGILVYNARTRGRFAWPEALLIATFFGLAWYQIRHMALFCIVGAMAAATLIGPVPTPSKKIKAAASWRKGAGTAVIWASALLAFFVFASESNTAGIGIQPGTLAAGDFLKTAGIRGAVFNNFDIGSYLIFQIFDGKGNGLVVADGRPEAYPVNYLQDTYRAFFRDENAWHDLDAKHHFDALVFSLNDPRVQQFIPRRVRDPEWAPVFGDNYALVFLRRTPEHAALIATHEIPRSQFR